MSTRLRKGVTSSPQSNAKFPASVQDSSQCPYSTYSYASPSMAAPELALVQVQLQPDYPAPYPSPIVAALVVGPAVVVGQQRPPCAVDHAAAQF